MDTVIIKISPPNNFNFLNKSWFVPEITRRRYEDLSPTEKCSDRLYLRHFVLKCPRPIGFMPRIEVFEKLSEDKTAIQYDLKAEFSVPKMLYGNSLQEVSEQDFGKVLSALKNGFDRAGVVVEESAIINATVSVVNFCKNVPLPKELRLQEALNELKRIDINKTVDVTIKEEKNGGRWLHIYSGTLERVFYDKVSDSMRPKVKRKDKGFIGPERDIIERYGLEKREVFRYEFRIKKAQTVKREINTALGRSPTAPVLFKDLFTPSLHKTVILNSWHKLILRPENQLALLGPIDNMSLLSHILTQAKNMDGGNAHTMNRALISYGLAQIARDCGIKELRRTIFSIWDDNHSERLTHKIEASAELMRGLSYSNTINYINEAFRRFEPISLDLLNKGI